MNKAIISAQVTKLARIAQTAQNALARETAALAADSLKDVLSLLSMGYAGRALHRALVDLSADHYRDMLTTFDRREKRRKRLQYALLYSIARRVQR